jgi:Ca2+-binding EF-hand superfamily protein
MVDIDGNGRISPQEYALFLKAYNVDERLFDDIFRHLDLNGDGYLSRDEIFKLVREFYLSDDPQAPGNWLVGPF